MSWDGLDDSEVMRRIQLRRLDLVDQVYANTEVANDPKLAKVVLAGLKDADSQVISRQRLKLEEANSKNLDEYQTVAVEAVKALLGGRINLEKPGGVTPEVVDHNKLPVIETVPGETYQGTEQIDFDKLMASDPSIAPKD